MNKPFIKAGYVGVMLVLVSIAIMAVNPAKGEKLPHGFFTPVIAFEFIRTEAEVHDLFGHNQSDEQTKIVNGMQIGTYIDFFYITVYSIFLLLFTFFCIRITGSKWFLLSGFIVLGICLSDIFENVQLLSIMAKLNAGEFSRELELLNFFTWAKWGGLTALFISFIPYLRKSGTFGRVISVTSLLSALAGSAAFLNRSVANEIYFLSIAAIFIMLILFSFTFTAVKQASE